MPYVINQEFCSCCHQCRVECPVLAITFRNGKYWIDPEKCVSCGKCQRVCHNACIMIPGDVGVGYIEGVFTALTQALNEGYIAGVEAAGYSA